MRSLGRFGVAGAGDEQPPAVLEEEADLRVRQRQPGHRLLAVGQLGRLALEELAPRGHVEEQIEHVDAGAARRRRVLLEHGCAAALDAQPGGRGRAGLAVTIEKRETDAMDGMRLAAEALGEDVEEPVGVEQLAGGVALEAQPRVFARHAVAVVDHRDRREPAFREQHAHRGGARVDGVLGELLHHAGRPLHHLAGGDLVDELVG